MMRSNYLPSKASKADGKSEFSRKNQSENKIRGSIEHKNKTTYDPKKAQSTPDPKSLKTTSLDPEHKSDKDNSTPASSPTVTSDLIPPLGKMASNRQSAGMRNLSKAKKFKDALMDAIKWLNATHTFERTPFRCAVIRAHYNWTASMFFLIFFYAVSTYYGEEPIRCIDQSNRIKASQEVLDICVQFPYTMKNHHPRLDGERTYATFYMWTHWGCLLLMILYKIVHVAVYLIENKGLKNIVDKLQKNVDYNYRIQLVKEYFQQNYGNHRSLVLKVILLHFIALLINVGTFFIVDLYFGHRYRYFPRYLAVKRDFVFFDDEYSHIFPPFAECEIGPTLHIQMGRTNYYGCHLALMEFYEKIFMILWFWQVFLALWTVVSLLEWSTYLFFKKLKLDAEELFRFEDTKKKIKKLPLDEVVVLNLIKGFLFGQHYRSLVHALLKWNPSIGQLDIPLDEYEIHKPYILGGLSRLHDQDIETFLEDLQQEIPVSIREEVFANAPPPSGWKLQLPLNAPLKPRPSAPSESPYSYSSTGDRSSKDGYGAPDKYGYTDRSTDSGVRTPSTVPAKDAYRSPSPVSSESWTDS